MFEKLFTYLFPYPNMCLFCHAPLDELGVCFVCETRLEKRKRQLGACRTCHHYGHEVETCQNCKAWQGYAFKVLSRYPYEKEVKDSLIKLKFQDEAWRGKALGKTLAPLVTRPYDFILPVPLHQNRLRERGYNQSLLLAQGLSEAVGIPLKKDLLIRIKNTSSQRTLSRRERHKNVKKAFLLKHQAEFKDKEILLVDDIMTTGATLFACAKLLFDEGGAKSVTGLTVASGIS